jgi:hypothetical protein
MLVLVVHKVVLIYFVGFLVCSIPISTVGSLKSSYYRCLSTRRNIRLQG